MNQLELMEVVKLAEEVKNKNYKAFKSLKQYLESINLNIKKEGA